jgi:SAM-dependent methyltransferase
MATAEASGYSRENAERFGWHSVGGELAPHRVQLLDRCVVGSSVLDAGCGGGGYVDYLARKGLDAVGADKHPTFLGVARERGFLGKFVEADLTDRLPFADQAFETTYCFDVLEHVDDRAALRELARVTRRRLILTVPQEDRWMQRHGLRFFTYQDPTHLRYYTPESLCELAASIHPAKVEVTGECPVHVRQIARTMLQPASKYPLLTRLYRRAFEFLLFRATEPEIFVNLVAVIDLTPEANG